MYGAIAAPCDHSLDAIATGLGGLTLAVSFLPGDANIHIESPAPARKHRTADLRQLR